jgi:hypothetical protein
MLSLKEVPEPAPSPAETTVKGREELMKEARQKGTVRTQGKVTLSLTLARCGEHRRAAAIAGEARRTAGPRELTEEVAGTYGLCVAAVQGDRAPERLGPEERAPRDRYRELALETAREGTRKGYQTFLFLEGGPDYEPPRALPEHGQLLAETKKGLKPG